MAVSASAGAAGGLRGRGVIAHYRRYLPVTDDSPVVTLGEGDTRSWRRPAWAPPLGRRALPQAGGHEPHLLVQGPGMTMP